MTRQLHGSGPNRSGATTIEFAICAPVLFLFTFASLEFSRVNMIRQTVENAMYEGCRRGIVPGATAQDVKDSAQVVLNAILAKDAQITVTPSVIVEDTPEVTVDIVVPIDANSWVTPLFFDGMTVSNSMTLRRERGLNISPF